VPRVGVDPHDPDDRALDAGTAERPGIGGPAGRRIESGKSVLALWEAMRRDLETSGAVVVETEFPAVSNYEGDRPGADDPQSRAGDRAVPEPRDQ
jgi:amidase